MRRVVLLVYVFMQVHSVIICAVRLCTDYIMLRNGHILSIASRLTEICGSVCNVVSYFAYDSISLSCQLYCIIQGILFCA